MKREELLSWEKEKLVDTLISYIKADESRRAKMREHNKNYHARIKSELEELRKFKNEQTA